MAAVPPQNDREVRLSDQFQSFLQDSRYLSGAGVTDASGVVPPSLPNFGLDDVATSATPEDLQQSITPNNAWARSPILYDYLLALCSYGNDLLVDAQLPNAELPSGNPLPLYLCFNNSFWEDLTLPALGLALPYEYIDDCRIATSTLENLPVEIQSGRSVDEVRQQLGNIRHLFIPILRDRGDVGEGLGGENHEALLVISPGIKLVEYFDNHHNDGTQFIYRALDWLKYEMEDQFTLEEWSWRQNDCALSNDLNGPNALHGLHYACINAFNVAFGLQVPGQGPSLLDGQAIHNKRTRVAVDVIRGQIELSQTAVGEAQVVVRKNLYLGIHWDDSQGHWVENDVPAGAEPPHYNDSERLTRLQYCEWAWTHRRDLVPFRRPVGATQDVMAMYGGKHTRLKILDFIRTAVGIDGWEDLKFENGWTVEMLKLAIYRKYEIDENYRVEAWSALPLNLVEVLRADPFNSMDVYRGHNWNNLFRVRMLQHYEENLGGNAALRESQDTQATNTDPPPPPPPQAPPAVVKTKITTEGETLPDPETPDTSTENKKIDEAQQPADGVPKADGPPKPTFKRARPVDLNFVGGNFNPFERTKTDQENPAVGTNGPPKVKFADQTNSQGKPAEQKNQKRRVGGKGKGRFANIFHGILDVFEV